LVFRVAGADPAIVQRYADDGFDEIVIWADQVWPETATLPDKRAALRAAAEALGLAPGAARPAATPLSSPATGRELESRG
jgi:hypothetical protein